MIKVLHPCKLGELNNKDLCVVYAEKNNIRYNITNKNDENKNECSACVVEYKENVENDFLETSTKTVNPQPIE